MLKLLVGKKVLLAVTGSIAAYKVPELIRLFKKEGVDVQVVMTPAATEFVKPLTLAALSEHTVHVDMFSKNLKFNVEHIELAHWADAVVIAPATANTLAKLTHGLADNLLTSICLATTAPICAAPAMNKGMWANPATQANIKLLTDRGVRLFGPGKGFQACGDIGEGRMLEPSQIVTLTARIFVKPLLKGKRVVITAGPTIESLDPVRFMSNHSSGKMGYAMAEAAYAMGAEVLLITGPTALETPLNVPFIQVTTAKEMHEAVMKVVMDCDIFIATAAVADYCPEKISPQKIKKQQDHLTINLIKNPDILFSVSHLSEPPFTVGFAAETEKLIEHAQAKLRTKNVDMIVANLVGENLGFGQDENAVTVITSGGQIVSFRREDKSMIAYRLMKMVATQQSNRNVTIKPVVQNSGQIGLMR